MEPFDPIERPRDVLPSQRRLSWLQETLQEEKKHASPSGTFRGIRRPHIFLGYVAQMSYIIDANDSTYEEVARK
jgi:hypothetical protein